MIDGIDEGLIKRMKALEYELKRLGTLPITAPVACRIYKSTDFVHNSTGNYLAIQMPNERWDTYGMHSPLTNPERITFTISGWYYVWGGALFTANATGYRQLGIRLGGTTVLAVQGDGAPSASFGSALSVSTIYYFAATNYVELIAYQNSGGNLNIYAGANYSPEFAVMRLP